MNKKLLAALLACMAIPAAAQTATPRVDQRQANQEQRIQQGKQSGALTNKEAAKLEKGQASVAKKEAKAKSDGKVTAKEKARLARAQDTQSRKIAKQKNDNQVKPRT